MAASETGVERQTPLLRLKDEGANMSNNAKNTCATVIPCLRYRDAPAAIEWLCENFGFVNQVTVYLFTKISILSPDLLLMEYS